LQRISDDGSIFLQDCNKLPSLTLCQLITDDNRCASVVVEESILQTRRQWLQLRKRRLRFLFFTKLTLAVRIYFLGEVNGIFFNIGLS
jgi:hypothetical protein